MPAAFAASQTPGGSGDAGGFSNSVVGPDKRSQGRLILGDCASLLHDPAAESRAIWEETQ